LWARSGQELFYRNGEAVIAVSIETDPSFSAANPEVMFEADYYLGNGGPNYDVSPDAERFLMIRRAENSSARPQIIVVQNWLEELERLVPTECSQCLLSRKLPFARGVSDATSTAAFGRKQTSVNVQAAACPGER